jgi:tetratricopeptide (TPR) repeat protein
MRGGRGLPRDTESSEAGVLYTEALTHERAARLNDARKGYLSVVQRYPQSPLVPLVYFAFGELFFQEGQSDPMKLALSEQSYQEVLKYPPPDNTATAFAQFRLAQIFEKSGKGQEALSMLYKFMTLTDTQPNAQCARSLADSARKLMVNTYAEVGQPSRAFSFFVRASGSRSSSKTNAFELLADLGDIYVRQQKPNQAAEALVAVNEDHAPREFCAREEGIYARVSSSISIPMRDEYLRMHAQRCE